MRKVAIAISTFNSGITLAQTLESLLQFEHLSGATFILLDGGSTDFSVNIFEWFKKKYDHSFGFEVRIYPGMHPAERLNILIEARYDFFFHVIRMTFTVLLRCAGNFGSWGLGEVGLVR